MAVFDRDSFQNPSNDFRPLQIVHGLDTALRDPEQLTGEEGIDQRLQLLRDLGLGGVVMNVGFKDYLVSPRQWEIYRYGLRKAVDLGLLVWLYDEKGYPSGTAGGIVTRAHPEYAALGLACYEQEVNGPADVCFDLPVSCRRCVWAGAMPDPATATRASVWDLSALVDAQGTLRWRAPAGHWTLVFLAERVMYEGTHAAANVSEFKHYVNLLKPEAVAEFLRVTHEQYVRQTPPELWPHIRAVFTDEPSLMPAYMPPLPDRFIGNIPVLDAPLFTDRPPAVPWVEDFLPYFKSIKGYDLTPFLFALFGSNSAEACYARQDYYEVMTRRYSEAFYAQVLRWCQAHGIASSGHVLLEEDITSHVIFHGSLYPAIRQMDLPGIDMLNSDPQSMLSGHSFMAVKQVSSAAHLMGRRRIHSESSDWEQHNQGRFATLAERRGQGNLQYVLGVNQITAYWAWDEIGEESYRAYNDYMGRLASLLVGGRHCCDVVLLYPVRSAWADFTPLHHPVQWQHPEMNNQTQRMQQFAREYPDLVRRLLREQIDLDIIDEEGIVEAQLEGGALCIADERYRAVVLPPLCALGQATARKLAAFVNAGGTLVSAGALPELCESAQGSASLERDFLPLFAPGGAAARVTHDAVAPLLRARLGADLQLDVPNPDILYTHRQLEGRDVYFVINNASTPQTLGVSLRVRGPYTLYRPLTGQITPAEQPLRLALDGYEGVFVVSAAA
jgi:hypothetical protein